GTNCAATGTQQEPTRASLSMYGNGTNIWYFDGVPQTGLGVEAMVGWDCLGHQGRGVWWGQTADSSEYWCNLFQVEYGEETRQATYINYAFGGTGQYASAEGSCPTTFDEIPPDALQASFSRTLGDDETFQFTCQEDSPQSCRPRSTPVPNPFADEQSLPVLDTTTCLPIDGQSSASVPSVASLILVAAALSFA
ncbi:hypothetical protein (Partial), partial [Seminavis robusta]